MNVSLKRAAAALALGLTLALAGCATVGSTAPGTPVDEVQARHGRPTAVYPRPEGGERLEYGAGSFGVHTWMVDVDASGRLLASTQVRNEAVFETLRPGMTRDEVLFRIGHPSQVRTLPRQNHELWSYLYENPFCLWYQVSIDRQTGRLVSSGNAIHPRCQWDERR